MAKRKVKMSTLEKVYNEYYRYQTGYWNSHYGKADRITEKYSDYSKDLLFIDGSSLGVEKYSERLNKMVEIVEPIIYVNTYQYIETCFTVNEQATKTLTWFLDNCDKYAVSNDLDRDVFMDFYLTFLDTSFIYTTEVLKAYLKLKSKDVDKCYEELLGIYVDNTCNSDSFLLNEIQYYTDRKDSNWWIVRVHLWGDVRGNYSEWFVVESTEDRFIGQEELEIMYTDSGTTYEYNTGGYVECTYKPSISYSDYTDDKVSYSDFCKKEKREYLLGSGKFRDNNYLDNGNVYNLLTEEEVIFGI